MTMAWQRPWKVTLLMRRISSDLRSKLDDLRLYFDDKLNNQHAVPRINST
jgi:hypothetical protein